MGVTPCFTHDGDPTMKRLSTTAMALSLAAMCLLPASLFAQKARYPSFSKSMAKPSSSRSMAKPSFSRSLSKPSFSRSYAKPPTTSRSYAKPPTTSRSFAKPPTTRRSQPSKPGNFPSIRTNPRLSPQVTRPITVTPRRPPATSPVPSLRGTNPNTSFPRITNPNVLNPRTPPTSSRIPNLMIRPNTTLPRVDLNRFNPGVRLPNGSQPRITIPNKPMPTLRGDTAIRNIKPDQSRLNGLRRFDSVVGKLDLAENFKPVPLDNIKESLEGLKDAQLNELKLPMGTKTKTAAIRHLGLRPMCHWWLDFCIGWHWHHHHCHWWDICYLPGYWNCWTPCYYNVVYCPPRVGYVACSWYFGVECVLIPDMGCYGIQ